MGERRGWFSRKLHNLTAEESELEAEDLRAGAEAAGARPMGSCADRSEVCVAGAIRCVTVKVRAGAPSLEADVYDGTGSVTLVFLGRRRIPGIEAGRLVKAVGRLTHQEQRATIFNPRYELLPVESASA